jgi:aldose 1-epimerase
MSQAPAPSGKQFLLQLGRQAAVVTEVGGGGPVELFTGDPLPDEGRRRRGLGIEPMTAAPDAFNSGDGLVVLEPGEVHTARWELRPEGS